MKEKIIENGIEYVRHGDYYLPNLTMPDDKTYNIGKYGRMHAKFIKRKLPCINVKMKMYKIADSKCTILASYF